MSSSQCDRVLAVLADGLPHPIEEIHERAGTMRLNSRISDLRKRGLDIACWSEVERGERTYFYRLNLLPADTGNNLTAPSRDGDPARSSSIASQGPRVRSESEPKPEARPSFGSDDTVQLAAATSRPSDSSTSSFQIPAAALVEARCLRECEELISEGIAEWDTPPMSEAGVDRLDDPIGHAPASERLEQLDIFGVAA